MINEVGYNPSSTPVAGGQQIDYVVVATGTPDFSIGSLTDGHWVGGVDDSDGYVIVGDTTSAGLAGWGTGGGLGGVAPSDTPTFWKTTARTDSALIALINQLPGSAGNYTTIAGALNFLAISDFGVINYTGSTSTGLTVTIAEVGFDVVMTISGSLNINDLTLVESGAGPATSGGINDINATFVSGADGDYYDIYSGFTTTATSFGSSLVGFTGDDSNSGDIFGVMTDMASTYLLIVPTGYVSGTEITSSQTFSDRTFAILGLVEDTYSYTWGTGGNAESINVVIGSGGGGGGAGWYFYSDAGAINAGPPIADGNAIFIDNTGGGPIETFDPNKANGVDTLNFNVKDSAGTDYTTQMNNLVTKGGTIEITQNSNNVTYTLSIGMCAIDPNAGDPFFTINAAAATQIEFTSSFVYGDPITLTISPNP
jgi:hypothetical protein